MRRLCSGHIGFAVVITTVSFLPKWANPLWEMADFPPASEPDRILGRVKVVIERLGEVDRYDMEVTDDNIRTEELPLLPAPAQLPSSWSFGARAGFAAVFLVLLGFLAALLRALRSRAAGLAAQASSLHSSADTGESASPVPGGWNLVAPGERSP